MASSSFRVRRRFDGEQIKGTVDYLAVEGIHVTYDPTDITKLVRANGVKGFMLRRDVVPLATLEARLIEDQVFPIDAPVKNPVAIGSQVAASRVLEAELEGPDLVLTSGTGALNGSTSVGAALSFNNGRIMGVQGGQETVGYVRAKLPVVDSDNAVRFLVEFVA